jgi:hypothetical protein
MSAPGPSAAIEKTVLVRRDVATAFRVWTERVAAWWPAGHSVSGDPRTTVHIEGRVGGRLYERTPAGIEHDWGTVVVWEPPRHLAYHWFLGSGPDRPTRVDVRFADAGDGRTRVVVRHQGPDLIGDLWPTRSRVFDAAWEVVLPAYVAACQPHA